MVYWIPKMNKNRTSAYFIIASKICSSQQIPKTVSNFFKLKYYQIKNFHENAKFLPSYNKFWVLQTSDSIIHSLNNMKKKRRGKSIANVTFGITHKPIS